jgi:alkylation response protein AidB-like acyl-CoA dehydrogenase
MDFQLTSEQQQVQQMVRDFAATHIHPHVMEWDEAQTFPLAVIKQLGELGLLGAIFPEQYGGAGMSYVDYIHILEELAAVESGIALVVAAHNSLACGHIYLAGNEEQKPALPPEAHHG